jgi:hypothetical protein
MPILHPTNAPNGINLGYHRAVKLEADLVSGKAVVTVASHADEAGFLAGLPLAWHWYVPLTTTVFSGTGSLLEELQDALIVQVDSPFFGGQIAADNSDTLEASRDRTWTRIKQARDVAEAADFTWGGSAFQADKARITGATQLALLAEMAGQPYSIDWTLSDNSVRTLDAGDMIAVGVALGQHVADAFETGRQLRAQIAAATTIAELNAIGWPQ